MAGPAGGIGAASVGFFGKLPGAGDFVQRRLPAGFVERWDRHFEQAVHASREAMGGEWAQAYRASPTWRFVLSPQACGEGAWAGVFGPAQDRVGRSFPMVLAAPVALVQIESLLHEGAGWFDALAHAHAQGQRGAAADAEGFDALVAALPGPSIVAPVLADPAEGIDLSRSNHWRLPLPSRAVDTSALVALWRRLVGQGPWCLWWSEGAGRVPPAILATRGLPSAEAYAGFLDAAWAGAWHTPAGACAPVAATVPVTCPPPGPVHLPEPDNDVTVPGIVRRAQAAVPASPAFQTELSVHTAPGVAVVHQPACALTLVAADVGPADPRRRAAAAAAGVAAQLSAADEATPGMHALRARLMALHPLLCHGRAGEDGAVAAARLADTQAGLLRIGAAGVWHWRGGRLHPLFADAPAQEPPPAPGGELDDLLFGGGAGAAPGLGAEGAPHCEQVTCELLPGDRLVLLAGVAHAQLSQAALAQALAAASAQDAQARLAQALGLTHSRPWPLAVIEVQP